MLLIFYEESSEDNSSSKTTGSVESNVDEVEKEYPNVEDGFDPIDNPVNSRLLQSKTDFQQRTSVSRLTLEVWFE